MNINQVVKIPPIYSDLFGNNINKTDGGNGLSYERNFQKRKDKLGTSCAKLRFSCANLLSFNWTPEQFEHFK